VTLVPFDAPESEADILTTVALLESFGIPCYVRGGGFGGLYPGVQVNAYNARTIMVPLASYDEARQLIAATPDTSEHWEFSEPEEVVEPPQERGLLRMVLEFLFFGWFIPGTRRRTRHT
jgi:hypothetical protein